MKLHRGAALLCLALASQQARASAPPGRYAIDDAGSQNLADDTVHDTRTGLVWQRSPDAVDRTASEASAYCADLKLDGRGGLRLPTRRELASLVDYREIRPAIDPSAFPGTYQGEHWTATVFAGDASAQWTVSFVDGIVDHAPATSRLRVRCVRAAP